MNLRNPVWTVKTETYPSLYSILLLLTCCFCSYNVAPSSTFFLGVLHSASRIILFLSLHILFLYYHYPFISLSFCIIVGISLSVVLFCLSLFAFRPSTSSILASKTILRNLHRIFPGFNNTIVNMNTENGGQGIQGRLIFVLL